MAKSDIVLQSTNNIIQNAKNARKAFDRTWNASSRAPIFCKITKKATGVNGKTKKTYRTSRLIGNHAYNIAASGAAYRASRMLKTQCDLLRVDAEEENPRAPWLPSISRGAKVVLEQFLCALAQEATYKGHAVREGTGNAKRLSAMHMKLGWDATILSVGASSIVPHTIIAMPLKKKSKKKKSATRKLGEADTLADEDKAEDLCVGDLAHLAPEV